MSSIMKGIVDETELDENLHKWFKEKWVRFGPDGKIRGACARGDDSEGKPKCLPQKKAQNLGKKGRKYAASKKRREDPNPERTGKAKNVATKKKTNEDAMPDFMKSGNMKPFTASGKEIPGSVATLEKLLVKAKERGIKLNYQNIDQMMQAVAKKHHLTGDELHNEFVEKNHMIPDDWIVKQLDEACWKGYHKEGNKKMFGKTYPNCVKNTNEDQDVVESNVFTDARMNAIKAGKDTFVVHGKTYKVTGDTTDEREAGIQEAQHDETCPHCGGELVSEELMNEKQDACYHKVKSRYKVWPSAYASGALVQCRKKGASNWGNGKKTESSIMKGIVDEAGSPAQQAAIAINMKKRGEKPKHVDEAKAKQYVKPYNDPQTGEQIGWVSSDGYHKKYWQKFAKASAIKHAKLNPDEVQEDYTGEFAAEKTPAINPYGGLEDNQFRGAISEGIATALNEMPETSGPVGVQPGGWRKYKPKPAGQLQEDEALEIQFKTIGPKSKLVYLNGKKIGELVKGGEVNKGWDIVRRHSDWVGSFSIDGEEIYVGRTEKISELKPKIARLIRSARIRAAQQTPVDEDTSYGGGMGQGGNAGESYRKFKPKSAGTFKEEEQLDEKCWDTHKQVGMKNKGGKSVPNCVPKESAIMKGLKR